jgi:hypothetical protein
MAVNKNFVVKNGLEVNTNLILADATNDRVGIGTTVPSYTLDVAGGIGATSMYIAGVTTALGNLQVGSAGTTLTAIGNSVGVGTDAPAYLLDVRSAVSTGQTALYVYGDMRVSGDINLDDIILDDVRATDLYITGLSTFVGLTSALDVRVGAALSVVGVSTFHSAVKIDGAIDANGALDVDGHTELDDVNVSGASTFAGAIDANGALDVDGHTELDDVNVSGASTFAGTAKFNGAIDANGDLDVDGTTNLDVLDVDGATNFGADVTFAGASYNVVWDKSADSLEFRDEASAMFGTNSDLEISHTNSLASQDDSNGDSVVDGWTSYINEQGTGGLVFKSNGNSGEGAYQFFDTSWRPIVRLFSGVNARGVFYYGGSPRLETTGIGVSVQGSVGVRTDLNVAGVATFGSANVVAAGGTFQVGAGGTVLYADTDGNVTIGSAPTLATVSLNGGSIPSIGLVIALGG